MKITSFIQLGVVLFGAVPGWCAEPVYVAAKMNGKVERVTVPAGSTKAIFYGVSTGKITSSFDLSVFGPQGSAVKVQAVELKESTPWPEVPNKLRYDLPATRLERVSAERNSCLSITVESETDEEVVPKVESFPELADGRCALSNMSELASELSLVTGESWSEGNACAYFVSLLDEAGVTIDDKDSACAQYDWAQLLLLGIDCYPSGGLFARSDDPMVLGSGYANFLGRIHKNACSKQKKPKYGVLITVDLAEAVRSGSGDQVTVRFKESKISRGMQSSIKPISEGRYAPRPLVLMNYLGRSCGNKINVYKWSKGKPSEIDELQPYGLLSYKGMILAIALVDGALRGGQGTFELNDGRETYGVCFGLSRTRQRKNGYPS